MTNGPLAGMRVVEFGNLIAGPYAGMLLADLGADVIKVEPPTGDLGRAFGPFTEGESVFFLAVNRGKRSVVLDLKEDGDRRRALALCSTADAIVHNLRKGVMERLGLGEDVVWTVKPDLIYTVVSAFGATGPYSDRAGIDVIFQAEAGMMSINGDPGSPPMKTGTTIGDYLAATNAALATCAALAQHPRTPRRIDVSLRDGVIAAQSGWNALAFHAGAQPPKLGSASPYTAPNQTFETADGHLALAIVSDRHFAMLCGALKRPDLLERYPTNEQRMAARADLADVLDRTFAAGSTQHWVDLLASAGLPVGRALTILEAFEDPQVIHNGMAVQMDHPAAGRLRLTGSPMHVDGLPALAGRPPPRLGEHTEEVLAGL